MSPSPTWARFVKTKKQPEPGPNGLSVSGPVAFRRTCRALTQMQCWRRHISASSSRDGWGRSEQAPASTVESILTGCITAWFGNSTAGNRKALQRVVRTARHIIGGELPSLQDHLHQVVYKESLEDHQGLQPPVPQSALSAALRKTSPQHPIPH